MGNIIIISQRVFPFLVFLILQFISFYFTTRYSEYHQSNLVSRSNYITAKYNEKVSDLTNFFNMSTYNEELTKENAALKQSLYNAQLLLASKSDDTAMQAHRPILGSEIIVQNAKVVSNSISHIRNFIIVNKGKNQGVIRDMSAISANGPVGIIVEVSDNYSCIMSVLNKDANVSVRVKNSNYVGQLRWKGGDVRMAALEEIPKHIKLKKGEIIETSGYSSYYPEGLPVGIVQEYKEDSKSNFANIKVKLYNDFTRLKYVYLINNNQQNEIKTLTDSVVQYQKHSNE